MSRGRRVGAEGPGLDGRNIAPEAGLLEGEGALQRVRHLEAGPARDAFDQAPSRALDAAHPTYYGLPVLKEPVWEWYIPAYFFVGGATGSLAVLGSAAQGSRLRGGEALALRCRFLATAGSLLSAVLLVADLGRPGRFLNMLRVFRPTSPMNMGTWIISAFGALTSLALLPDLPLRPLQARALRPPAHTRARQRASFLPLRRARERARPPLWVEAVTWGSGLLGLPMSSYTGVLLAGTAVPLWQGTRRTLPLLFAASAGASAASLLELFPEGQADGVVRRFGAGAKVADLVLGVALEREAAAVPRVAAPLRRGLPGALFRASQALTAASLALTVLGRGHRPSRLLAGAMGVTAGLALRFGVVWAGRASARDPRATFEQQRAGHGAAEVVGRAAGPRALRATHERELVPGARPEWVEEGEGQGNLYI